MSWFLKMTVTKDIGQGRIWILLQMARSTVRKKKKILKSEANALTYTHCSQWAHHDQALDRLNWIV